MHLCFCYLYWISQKYVDQTLNQNPLWFQEGLTFMWLLVNQEKTLLAVDCSCVTTLGMSLVQEYVGHAGHCNLFQDVEFDLKDKEILN